MKRFRLMQFDFDTRMRFLTMEIKDEREESNKQLHLENRESIVEGLKIEFGLDNFDTKLKNFIDSGAKKPSIIAFHNKFLKQVRHAFIAESYYPALTGACALGERILNHLIISLRDDYISTPEYKKVYRKDSFDNRDLAIEVLENRNILLPQVIIKYKELKDIRNSAIHFKPEVDTNDKMLAFNAIQCLQDIIHNQFSALGEQPWFFISPGEI